jgi:hypothetical protein
MAPKSDMLLKIIWPDVAIQWLANTAAVLFGMHYGASFHAGEELVLPKHTLFLVITKGENADGSGYMW